MKKVLDYIGVVMYYKDMENNKAYQAAMTVQDALIDYKAPLAERARVLINNAIRINADYNLKNDLVVEMGTNSLPYVIPVADDPLSHQSRVEELLHMKDEAARARRNQPVHPFFGGPRRAGR